MTSSSEEDASRGVEGLDAAGGRSESVTYPRFFLLGMTSSSDSSSSLTGAGAGAGAGNASGTRSRSAAASSFDHFVRRNPQMCCSDLRRGVAGGNLDAHRVANVKARRRDNKLASSGPSLPLCRQREQMQSAGQLCPAAAEPRRRRLSIGSQGSGAMRGRGETTNRRRGARGPAPV